jgi:hypothetical protein
MIQGRPYSLMLVRFTSKVRDGLAIIPVHAVQRSKPDTAIVSFQDPAKHFVDRHDFGYGGLLGVQGL